MGNDTKKRNQQQRDKIVNTTSNLVNNQAFKPSPLEGEMSDFSRMMNQNYSNAVTQQTGDYSNIMGNYRSLYGDISGSKPTTFKWDDVSATRPEELTESYGLLREALPGYRDFAATGGYSDKDQRELRARGMSPIRSAYSGTIRDLDRSRSLGGNAGSTNYIAARSRAQRELPGQMADAMTGVNASLADAIRQGKLAGLAGISGIGSTMGGLSSAEAGRILQANLANSGGRLQAAGMTHGASNDRINQLLGTLNAQGNLYGTTPGMASMFGNQALQGFNTRAGMENSRNATGLGMIDSNLRALGYSDAAQGEPWWKKALQIGSTAAPYIGMIASDKNLKEDITPMDSKKVVSGLKKLNLHKWKYKGDSTSHVGPMAQDFKKHLGVGDGKTIHLADVMGVMLASAKEATS